MCIRDRFKQCLDKGITILGENHPETFSTMNNLAITYAMQDKYDDAEVLFKQCLDKSKAILGKNHPQTLGTINNLAAIYKSQGKYDEANALMPSTI